MPDHAAYVEVFGGGAGVLLRKPRAKVEVYNDLDGQVVNLFRCLQDPTKLASLIRLLTFTPFSRDEHALSYEPTDDPVEAARRFVFRTYSGHGTCSIDPRDSNGFRSCDIRSGKSYAREWAGIPDAIAAAAGRFVGVTIENRDFRKLIPKFDAQETLLFCDPPYPMSTRSAGGKCYTHEMCDASHRQLAWLLKRCSSKVMLTSYQSRLYDDLYADWHRIEKKTTANGQVGSVSRTEVLWLNFVPSNENQI